MRKFAAPLAVFICLFAAQAAQAAIPQIFTNTTSPVNCTVQASGARFCGTSTATVPSFDGTPIDVAMAFPPASGSDDNYPVIGIYHGWGGTKITPANMSRYVSQGYAVFSITDRGWGASCGGPAGAAFKAAPCANGYIHLMHNAYEVRDVQYLLGKLADQGVINGQKIGATGGSYGGGMSVQLGALRDRVQLPDGSLIKWLSPNGKAMRIAATAPEFPWTDLAQSLMPNGSSLDYVADSPYQGVNGDHRFGIQKQNWNTTLFTAAQFIGYLAPAALSPVNGNLSNWNTFNSTGGPYSTAPGSLALEQMTELPNHGAYYTDLSQPPAPALLSSGWNDDLFPVDETVRYYNKVRYKFPNAEIKLFELNFGHSPRANGIAGDTDKLAAAEDAWFGWYLKGTAPEPANVRGGVDILTSACPAGTLGTRYTAPNWASLAPGEVRLADAATKSIVAPGTAPANAFTSGNVCTTQSSADNASAATYKTDPAPAGGYTLAGSPTVIAELNTTGANDMIAARLYDVNGGTETLIGRQLYRPLAVGAGFTEQVFQLHPQAWNVAAGHVLKLELLTLDSTYARLAPGRASIGVRNLQLRLPTIDAPGAAAGVVQTPLPDYLPPNYIAARVNGISKPGAPTVTEGTNPNATGLYRLGWTASQTADTIVYTLEHHDADSDWSNVDTSIPSNEYEFVGGSAEAAGTWTYRTNAHRPDGTPPTEPGGESSPIKVDKEAPAAATAHTDRDPDYVGGGGWYRDTVDVSFTDNGDPNLPDGSAGSGVDVGSLPLTTTHSDSGSFTDVTTVRDAVGNESGSTSITVQVDARAPTLSVDCPAIVLLGATASATIVASDGESGLTSDPSATPSIDTSTLGTRVTSATAEDHVGHSVTKSCSTAVQYMYSDVFQPINPDGSSVFKAGSTVPVKFALTDAAAHKIGNATATLSIAKVSDTVVGTFNEAVSTSAATTGSLFRYDATGQQYIFNLSTKGMSPGTYVIKVSLDDGTTYPTVISLK